MNYASYQVAASIVYTTGIASILLSDTRALRRLLLLRCLQCRSRSAAGVRCERPLHFGKDHR